jgi:hypothetical protein
MSRDDEAPMPPEMILSVLAQAGPELVLVGGNALAFWMDRYGVDTPDREAAISRDVDLLSPDAADSSPLPRIARAIGGRPEVLAARAISALIGSAFAPAEHGLKHNVDLLHRVVGLTSEEVFAEAITVHLPAIDHSIRVMHPVHVLQSRNANLHTLPEKQDATGRLQFRLAIDVARAFLEDEIDAIDHGLAPAERDRAVFDAVAPVVHYSKLDAARGNAEKYALHLADAVPAWRIAAPVFWEKQWPHLRERMSAEYAARCEERAGRGATADDGATSRR